MFSVELLSRFQFAFTISFHILFPAFSIGLALFLVIMEGIWLKTKNPVYQKICKFWIKIFALTFGMGVVSGIVMEFQLGTNWAGFSKQIGSVLGPLFVYEVMTAFFIEAGSLGIMLFAWNKVGNKLHYFSTILVMLGTFISAYWIMAANTWMQHPIGYAIENGKFIATNWHDIVLNSTIYTRFCHMLFASYISAFFVILGVSAHYLYKNNHVDFATITFKFAAFSLIIMIPIQILIGDLSGLAVYKNQPLKTAAIESLWETQRGASMILFAIPDQENQKNKYEISIPKLSSLLNTHQWDGEIVGLKAVQIQDQPPVWPVFFSFRIMVGLGFIMLILAIIAITLILKNKLNTNRKLLRIFTLSSPIGFIALWFGWITAEIGRQPWVVYNLIRTRDAVSNISIYDVTISFLLIIIVYGIIFGYFYFYFLIKVIKQGPSINSKNKEPFEYMNPNIIQESNNES